MKCGKNVNRQVDEWLAANQLNVEFPAVNNPMAGYTLPDNRPGLVIQCREKDGFLADALAKALAPALAGEVAVLYVPGARPNQLDLFIQSVPRFGKDGVAFFPAVESGQADA